MKFGVPWSAQEKEILAEYNHCHPSDISKQLLDAGFNRSVGAIERKLRRSKQSSTIQFLGSRKPFFPDNLGNESKDYSPNIEWKTGSLELNNNDITKFVMLNDVHVPHNIDLTNVFHFIEDFSPDYILLAGDIVNNDPFNHWAKSKPGLFKGMPSPKSYYEDCNNLFYRPLRKIIRPDCKLVHWIGNHEYWSNRAIEEMPEGEGYWEVWNNIEGIDLWVPNKQIANLGKLHILHGDVIKGGAHHASKMLGYFRRNIRYGHFHDKQEASYTSPIDIEDRHTARSCGTLQNFNPSYMQNSPHNWVHAFTYGVIFSDGTFSDHTTVITNNRFLAHGKIYG